MRGIKIETKQAIINTMLTLFMCLTLYFIIQGSLWLLSISLILLVIGYFIEIALTNMVVIEDN